MRRGTLKQSRIFTVLTLLQLKEADILLRNILLEFFALLTLFRGVTTQNQRAVGWG